MFYWSSLHLKERKHLTTWEYVFKMNVMILTCWFPSEILPSYSVISSCFFFFPCVHNDLREQIWKFTSWLLKAEFQNYLGIWFLAILWGENTWDALPQPYLPKHCWKSGSDHFENGFGIGSPGFGQSPWSCTTKSLNLVFCGRQTSVWWMEIHLDVDEQCFLKSIQRSL